MIFSLDTEIGADFDIVCTKCGFHHQAGETSTLYEYDLINEAGSNIIQSGAFEILHDDYIGEADRFKYCIVCGSLKPLNLFDRHSARKTGRQSECNLCKQIYNSIKNQTRLVEQHREASQKRRLYTQFETEKFDIESVYKRFGHRCFKCNLDLSADLEHDAGKKLGNLDHTLPVYYLWPLTTNNATLLCRNHNGEKAEKWPSQFYTDAELRRLTTLTGIDYRLMAGAPTFNPQALTRLQAAEFVEKLFEKFARYPEELLRLRNRIRAATGQDFLAATDRLSATWTERADAIANRPSERGDTDGA